MKHAILVFVSLAAIAAIAVTFSGCQSQPPDPMQSFIPQDEPLQTTAIFNTQISRGARADGTLYLRDFDGPILSILGEDKLDLMLKDNSTPLPLVVYLDLPDTDIRANARTEAVKSFLTEAGLKPAQFKIEMGPNPATLHAAAPAIARRSKTENPPTSEINAGDGQPPAPMGLDPSMSALTPKK